MIKRLAFLTAIALVITYVLRTFVFTIISVASSSMEPTLPVGTLYIVNLLAYRTGKPQRGDIIVFDNPFDHDRGSIKRLIALPGDTIEMDEKVVILNGKKLQEPYAMYKRPGDLLAGDNLKTKHVPEGHVFVLGDNRDESLDSTTWKDAKTGERAYFLPETTIKGKLIQIP